VARDQQPMATAARPAANVEYGVLAALPAPHLLAFGSRNIGHMNTRLLFYARMLYVAQRRRSRGSLSGRTL
jgi:Flp pilus assembly pilin Flp